MDGWPNVCVNEWTDGRMCCGVNECASPDCWGDASQSQSVNVLLLHDVAESGAGEGVAPLLYFVFCSLLSLDTGINERMDQRCNE